MVSNAPLDVAIIGTGPGGAAAVNSILRVSPHLKVKAFERAARLHRVGFTIGVMKNGFSALKAILTSEQYQQLDSFMLPSGEIARYTQKGEELSRRPMVDSPASKFAGIPWYRLQQTLLGFLPSDSYELGCHLTALDITTDGVKLQFAGKPDPVHAKIVIGCDGNMSVVRQASNIGTPGLPVFTNWAMWRGQTDMPESWPHKGETSSWFSDGFKPPFIHVKSWEEGRLAWLVCGAWPAEKVHLLGSQRYVDATAMEQKNQAKLDRCLDSVGADWSPVVLELLRSTDPTTVTEHGQFYREPWECTVWGRGAVTLLGDAAHLATPILGQGLNQTLEDAAELGRAIGKLGPTEEALREYERVRVPRASKIQAASVELWKAMGTDKARTEWDWSKENPWCLSHETAPLV